MSFIDLKALYNAVASRTGKLHTCLGYVNKFNDYETRVFDSYKTSDPVNAATRKRGKMHADSPVIYNTRFCKKESRHTRTHNMKYVPFNFAE